MNGFFKFDWIFILFIIFCFSSDVYDLSKVLFFIFFKIVLFSFKIDLTFLLIKENIYFFSIIFFIIMKGLIWKGRYRLINSLLINILFLLYSFSKLKFSIWSEINSLFLFFSLEFLDWNTSLPLVDLFCKLAMILKNKKYQNY